ncbi:HNH endonuclease signature motif containing protein [Cryptosporangium aurantiacum]|uniref:HNH endonuclease n=1 Tax=Cryptosporangium aurantiacum TaxID=134849 RepID=A0A1M7TYY0_9ACTN|nr:HNH endonuclease signature motif containing protein [Cryptosporangium aurantiacum]SHN75956.1 HNH endonuclease [Cryptosporangium aurantiacum]
MDTPVERLEAAAAEIAGADLTGLSAPARLDRLRVLHRARCQLDAAMVTAVGTVHREGAVDYDGAVSTQSWLRGQLHMAPGGATDLLEAARHLPHSPGFAEAFAAGRISLAHVVVAARLAKEVGPEHAEQAVEALLGPALDMDPAALKHVAKRIRLYLTPDRDDDPPDKAEQDRSLYVSQTFDGIWDLKGALSPEAGALIRTALSAALGPPAPDDDRSPAQRRHDALADVLRLALSAAQLPTVGGEQPHLSVLVHARDLQTTPPRRGRSGSRTRTVLRFDGDDALTATHAYLDDDPTPTPPDWTTDPDVAHTWNTPDRHSPSRHSPDRHSPDRRSPVDADQDNLADIDWDSLMDIDWDTHADIDWDTVLDTWTDEPNPTDTDASPRPYLRSEPDPQAGPRKRTDPRPQAAPRPDARHRPDPPLDPGLAGIAAATGRASRMPGPGTAVTDWGGILPAHAARRIACDAGVNRVVLGPGDVPLSAGRRTRLPTPAMRRVLIARDGGCRFHGCDRPPAWTEAHHVTHWADGGPTNLDNLVLLCPFHHHRATTTAGNWTSTDENSRSPDPTAPPSARPDHPHADTRNPSRAPGHRHARNHPTMLGHAYNRPRPPGPPQTAGAIRMTPTHRSATVNTCPTR